MAMRMALSARLAEKLLTVVDGIHLDEIKTKAFAQIMQRFKMRKALIVVAQADNKLALSARNIPGVTVQCVDRINTYDVLRHPHLVMLSSAVDRLQERLQ
jgi:large subunit ribosomal protein L4